MSGALIPYHQRQNKAVDRQLFIDLLSRLNRYAPIANYDYFSFGGPFLEDFKLIHSHFGNKRLFSIENDKTAFARQKFNLPLNCISCVKQDSSVFVEEYASQNNAIIWLDFANASETRLQIQQFQTLIAKLQAHDIVKITLNANPDVLCNSSERDKDGKRISIDERNKRRLEKFEHRMGDYLPQGTTDEQMTAEELPKLLCRIIEFAANKAMEGRLLENLNFQPLASFAYSDSQHQMLTVTGILLSKKENKKFFQETQIKRWKPATPIWGNYKKIMVPALTAMEKIFIDQLLPKKTSKEIQRKLNFLFDKKKEISLQLIENYKLYYRYYPNFHKVIF